MTNQTTARKAYRLFDFILKFKTEHDGNSPSIREIGNGCGINSTSLVKYYLGVLEGEGKITIERKVPGKNRMINVTGGNWSYQVPNGGSP